MNHNLLLLVSFFILYASFLSACDNEYKLFGKSNVVQQIKKLKTNDTFSYFTTIHEQNNLLGLHNTIDEQKKSLTKLETYLPQKTYNILHNSLTNLQTKLLNKKTSKNSLQKCFLLVKDKIEEATTYCQNTRISEENSSIKIDEITHNIKTLTSTYNKKTKKFYDKSNIYTLENLINDLKQEFDSYEQLPEPFKDEKKIIAIKQQIHDAKKIQDQAIEYECSALRQEILSVFNNIEEHKQWLTQIRNDTIYKYIGSINEDLQNPPSIKQLECLMLHYNALNDFNNTNKDLLQEIMLKECTEKYNDLIHSYQALTDLKEYLSGQKIKPLKSFESFFNKDTKKLVTPSIFLKIRTCQDYLNKFFIIIDSGIEKKINIDSSIIEQTNSDYAENNIIFCNDSTIIKKLDTSCYSLKELKKDFQKIPFDLQNKEAIEKIDRALNNAQQCIDKEFNRCITIFNNLNNTLSDLIKLMDDKIYDKITKKLHLDLNDMKKLIALKKTYNSEIQNNFSHNNNSFKNFYTSINNMEYWENTIKGIKISTYIDEHINKIEKYIEKYADFFVDIINDKMYKNGITTLLNSENITKTQKALDSLIRFDTEVIKDNMLIANLSFAKFKNRSIEIAQLIDQIISYNNLLTSLTQTLLYLENKSDVTDKNLFFSNIATQLDVHKKLFKRKHSDLIQILEDARSACSNNNTQEHKKKYFYKSLTITIEHLGLFLKDHKNINATINKMISSSWLKSLDTNEKLLIKYILEEAQQKLQKSVHDFEPYKKHME